MIASPGHPELNAGKKCLQRYGLRKMVPLQGSELICIY